jgi:hypothetical protein
LARVYKDGNGTYYDGALAKFIDVPFGTFRNPGVDGVAGTADDTNDADPGMTPFNFGSAAAFAQKADNSVAGEMMDCGECHVGGGMMEYRGGYDAAGGTFKFNAANRIPLRPGQPGYVAMTGFNAFNTYIDIFNPIIHDEEATPAAKAAAVSAAKTVDFSTSGVLEMDCLMCHLKDYNWHERKEAVRQAKFDASRVVGAHLGTAGANGVTVAYNANVQVDALDNNKLYVDLSASLNSRPDTNNCAACHMAEYNVDWKKRGDVYLNMNPDRDGFQVLNGVEVHAGIGCMGCHEREAAKGITRDASGNITAENVNNGAAVATDGSQSGTPLLSLCDPAKGAASPFDAMWNKLDKQNFKHCSDCHTASPTVTTYGAADPTAFHTNLGLMAPIAYKADGTPASHLDIIDCSACHMKKVGFTGGAFVDGTGADEEGRVALHDDDDVARQMEDGIATHWLGGKIHGANLLTSSFLRDMNGLDPANGGVDINNDGRAAGLDVYLQTHINNLNRANGWHAVMEDGVVNATEMGLRYNAAGTGPFQSAAGIGAQLGVAGVGTASNPVLPKYSVMMVPFKQTHNIAPAGLARGVNGCSDCHGADRGFYNGKYPVNGNMAKNDQAGAKFQSGRNVVDADTKTNLTFSSGQVTVFTKVNSLSDTTDSHPNVVTKKGDRTVPVVLWNAFDKPFDTTASVTAYMRDIDRSEMLYEATFKKVNSAFTTSPIVGTAVAAGCGGITTNASGRVTGFSPFYCEDAALMGSGGFLSDPLKSKKAGATTTRGWLLKIDVDSNLDGVLDVSRTKQMTAAGQDKITDMAGFVTALGTFATDFEFTISQSGGALTITPKAGNAIRLNVESDLGNMGLTGALHVTDPIIRSDATAKAYAAANDNNTDVDVEAVTGNAIFRTRAGYVGYLNSLGSFSFPTPTAAFTLTESDATADGEVYLVNGAINLAATVGSNTAASTYAWFYTNGDTEVVDGNTVNKLYSITTGTTASWTPAAAGNYGIVLKVTNEYGKTSSAFQGLVVKGNKAAIGAVTEETVAQTKNSFGEYDVLRTAAVVINADTAMDPVGTTYTWKLADGTVLGTTAVLTTSFNTVGRFLVSLEANSAGYKTYAYQWFKVTEPDNGIVGSAIALGTTADAVNATTFKIDTTVPVTLTDIPDFTLVKVSWGDGTMGKYTKDDLGVSAVAGLVNGEASFVHAFAPKAVPTYAPKFYFYNVVNGYQKLVFKKDTGLSVTVSPAVDLIVKASVSATKLNGVYQVNEDANTSIIISVTNKSKVQNTVTVPVVLPAGVVPATNAAGDIAPRMNNGTYTFGTGNWATVVLAPSGQTGSSATLTIPVKFGTAGVITNATVANAATAAAPALEVKPGNNSASISVNVKARN